MYLITNRYLCSEDRYLEVLKEASYSGVDYVVLREKDLNNEELEKLYYKVKNIINKDTKLIINNNVDIYEKVDADGIHLSFNKFMEAISKDKFKYSKKIIGVSTHSLEEVKLVEKYNANYIFLSHIYETKCKEGLKPKGLELLKEAYGKIQNSNLKLVALGGILPNNSKDTLKYCDDIAVMSTIMKSDNVENTINEYMCY